MSKPKRHFRAAPRIPPPGAWERDSTYSYVVMQDTNNLHHGPLRKHLDPWSLLMWWLEEEVWGWMWLRGVREEGFGWEPVVYLEVWINNSGKVSDFALWLFECSESFGLSGSSESSERLGEKCKVSKRCDVVLYVCLREILIDYDELALSGDDSVWCWRLDGRHSVSNELEYLMQCTF